MHSMLKSTIISQFFIIISICLRYIIITFVLENCYIYILHLAVPKGTENICFPTSSSYMLITNCINLCLLFIMK